MKTTRKWLTLFLALALMCGIAVSGTAMASGTYDEKLTISFANVGPIEGYDYTAGDDYAKYWSEKFNWEIDMVGLTWDNWNEMLRIWISSQDMPDVAVFNYNGTTHPDAASFAEQGLVKEMPDDWRERWPNVASVFDKTSLGPQMEEAFGGVYFLPRARFDQNLPGDPLPNHMSLHLRKDWAEAVGFPIKEAYTTSEIIEYGKLIVENDPGNVGSNLVGLSFKPEYATRVFVYGNSTYYDTFYKDTDGEYKWGAASDDTLAGLKLYYEAYTSGALNPEFYTLRNEDDNDAFRKAGTAAATYMGGTATGLQVDMIASFETSLGLDSTEAYHVANVVDEQGRYHQQDLINYWGAICFSPTIDDAKFERYMDALDYGCTPEGYLLQVAGFEGEDYEYVDGEMVSLVPEGTALEGTTGKYPSIGGYNLANMKLWDDFSFENPIILPRIRELSWDLYQDRVKLGTPETFPATDWTVFTHDSPSRRQIAYDYPVEYTNLVTSAGSVEELEANWRDWIDSQMPLVQPVLDELNAK